MKDQAKAVYDYVLNAIDFDGTEKEKLNFFWETFKSEYGYAENFKRYGTMQKTVEEWLKGLPSAVNIDFTYYDIEKLLREWGYLKDNSTPKKVEKEVDFYWHRCAGALLILLNKYTENTRETGLMIKYK